MHSFARRVFLTSGIYGLIVLAPQYLLESRIGRDTPPAITHAEYFYGFLGIAIAWQLCFLAIGREPDRLRPVMIPAIVEKLTFGLAVPVLYFQRGLPGSVVFFACLDLVWAVLFFLAWRKTGSTGWQNPGR